MTAWKRSFSEMSDNAANNESSKILSSLGLCVRAGKAVFGVPMICDALRRGGKEKPVAVFEASDTSDNTHKRINDKCGFYNVRIYRLQIDGATLARALGKTASLGAVAVTDENLAKLVNKSLAEG